MSPVEAHCSDSGGSTMLSQDPLQSPGPSLCHTQVGRLNPFILGTSFPSWEAADSTVPEARDASQVSSTSHLPVCSTLTNVFLLPVPPRQTQEAGWSLCTIIHTPRSLIASSAVRRLRQPGNRLRAEQCLPVFTVLCFHKHTIVFSLSPCFAALGSSLCGFASTWQMHTIPLIQKHFRQERHVAE